MVIHDHGMVEFGVRFPIGPQNVHPALQELVDTFARHMGNRKTEPLPSQQARRRVGVSIGMGPNAQDLLRLLPRSPKGVQLL